jgi:hypothetical protein
MPVRRHEESGFMISRMRWRVRTQETGLNGHPDGADGIHSGVRRLAFGPEADSVEHFGMYVTTARLWVPLERDET